MNRNLWIILILCLTIFCSLVLFLVAEREAVPPQSIEVEGHITKVLLSARVITIETNDKRHIDIAVSDATELTDSEGVTASLTTFAVGTDVISYGRYTSDIHFLADQLQIVPIAFNQ